MEKIDTNAGNKEEPSDANKVTYLRIQDATCASCVNKIESAPNKVSGVEEATMNLAQGTASVTSNTDVNSLVRAIESSGYTAEHLSDHSDQQLLDEKDRSEQAYYTRLMREMWIALALGDQVRVRPGEYPFTCRMQMYRGDLVVREN